MDAVTAATGALRRLSVARGVTSTNSGSGGGSGSDLVRFINATLDDLLDRRALAALVGDV